MVAASNPVAVTSFLGPEVTSELPIMILATKPIWASHTNQKTKLCTPIYNGACTKYLTACKKLTEQINTLMRYCSLKNPAIWLDGNILAYNLKTRMLADLGFVIENQ